jgi:hypothetical protein
MILIVVVVALAVLALITQAGVLVPLRYYPARGVTITVTGANRRVDWRTRAQRGGRAENRGESS